MTAEELESRIVVLTFDIVAIRGAVADAARKQDAAKIAMDAADGVMGRVIDRLRDKENERTGLEQQLAQLKGAVDG